jgi:hypothetical protein
LKRMASSVAGFATLSFFCSLLVILTLIPGLLTLGIS